MTKQQFLDRLYEALCESMDKESALKHINYYTDYIESKVKAGEGEEKVVASLDNPRLIAKSLVEAGEEAFRYNDDVYEEYTSNTSNYNRKNYKQNNTRVYKAVMGNWSFWLVLAFLILILLTLIGSVVGLLVIIGKIIMRFIVPIVIAVGVVMILKILKK